MSVNSELLKEIRRLIREAKASGDVELELAKLSIFQQLHIEYDFPLGTSEIHRYVKRLEKLDRQEEADLNRKMVDAAFESYLLRLKHDRVNQIKESSEFVMIKASGQECNFCEENNDRCERIENTSFIQHYLESDCKCNIFGMSEFMLKRKSIPIPN